MLLKFKLDSASLKIHTYTDNLSQKLGDGENVPPEIWQLSGMIYIINYYFLYCSVNFLAVDNTTLFHLLYTAKTELEVDKIIERHPSFFTQNNWFPIGGNFSNYGIIENQQSSPIAALVEKVTNSMDAILMKKCLEAGIHPESDKAPKSMDEAVQRFFPNYKNWDIPTARKQQAEDIQVIADGPPRDTSVIVYDNGEGQHPEDFENTFLSLVRGNKNKIMFVQGKYNMGGAGAIVFCGKHRYQLIASKKFDNSGQFGFTLIRMHRFTKEEAEHNKNTWYEFLKIDGKIPAFDLTGDLDLKLFNRKFKTGSIIKMYSYQFPSGYSGFAQDLNQSFNEFLFQPVLPVYTIDKKERYPNNNVLELDLFGLKRRLEEDNKYIDTFFSDQYEEPKTFGKMKVTCYVFKAKVGENDVKKTKENIRRNFFKNNMSVMFSLNGQAHGHYTSEFITRQLKFNLLKDYLLIHVDCTEMHYDFRKELFMASRDRLKQGEESNYLREYLGKKLRKSQLDEIDKRRKDAIGFESEDTSELLKSFAKNLPKDTELFKLLENTLKLEEKKKDKTPQKENKQQKEKEEKPFNPQRFPSFFRLYPNGKDAKSIPVPIGGEKTLKFETDVEDHYFDRTEEPGDLQVSVLTVKQNEVEGGDKQGEVKEPTELFNVVKSSPNKGTIKITFSPNSELRQGDEVQVKASLKGAGDTYQDEIVWLKIVEPEAPKDKAPKQDEDNFEQLGLPELKKVTKEQWDNYEAQGISMNYDTVMFPQGAGDKLEAIYVNLDSKVFLNHRKKLKNEEQITTAQKKYLASVYFHSLFLYMITKRKNYSLVTTKDGQDSEDVTVDEYIRDVFDSYYSDFLLNFGMDQLINSLED